MLTASALHMFHIAAIGLISLLLLPAVQGQGGFTDPRSNICLFDNHKAIVVGETLFVDGGEWASDLGFNKDNGIAPKIEKWQSASSIPAHPSLSPRPPLSFNMFFIFEKIQLTVPVVPNSQMSISGN